MEGDAPLAYHATIRSREGTLDMMTAPHIAISQDVAGGKPRIAGHRITVQHIVIWHERMGLSADEIASEHGLTLADVYAALTYYYDHRQEIDEAILADDSYVVELRKGIKSKLSGSGFTWTSMWISSRFSISSRACSRNGLLRSKISSMFWHAVRRMSAV
jgi:uncharacterized protein (DUF433 family)